MTIVEVAAGLGIGAIAGVLGGLAGVGGSMIILPGLHMVFGDHPEARHHAYMAAAMTVNVAVALPASLKHRVAGAVRQELVGPLMLSTIAMLVVGVLISNRVNGNGLKIILAAFIASYCCFNIWRILQRGHRERQAEHPGVGSLVISGGITGFIGGLLGLGGGVLLVPFLQLLCKVPLRQSIATSSAVIAITAVVGATLKLSTLHTQSQSVWYALSLAAIMAPTAILGAQLGAKLTHRLPLKVVRLAITILLMLAAAKLADVW
ncbi:MAG: sulfite exporter TauE/SafE family protein [Phycisphaerales bacterium]|nr:sulfite exporter TauE/SafE family protein [Phycisphaerales bacterium]